MKINCGIFEFSFYDLQQILFNGLKLSPNVFYEYELVV